MPVSVTFSEAEFFRFVWHSVVALSTLSVLIVLVLILIRHIECRKNAKNAAYKNYLDSYMNAVLTSPLGIDAMFLAKLTSHGKEILCELCGDRLRILKGTESQQIIRILTHWGLQDHIEETARKGRREKRIEALGILAHFNDQKSLAVIEEQIETPETYVQLAALRSLAKRGARGVLEPEIILNHLEKIKDTNLMMLADILRYFGEDALEVFGKAAKKSKNVDVILAIIMAMGNIGSPLATKDLLDLAKNHNANIRAQAVAALGKIKDLRAAPFLVERLKDDKMPVRVQAAKAIGMMHYEPALPVLTNLSLHDKNWWVRFRAAEAIFGFGDRGISILRSLQDHKTLAGKMAIQILEEKKVAP